MEEPLCFTCKNKSCGHFFNSYDCEDYIKEFKAYEVMNLFYGMNDSMQHAIFEIMKVTQIEKES